LKKTPWKTDQWYTSPWNFAEEVTENFNFPDDIKLHDITLRDGEQQAGIIMNKDEKIKIAEALAQSGVQRIEAGMPAVSEQDKEAIKEIVKRDLENTEIFAFSRCMVEDVKQAVDTGVDGIVVEIPASEHIIEHAYQWPLEKAIELAIEATSYAHKNGLYTVFFPIDGTRAEIDWFLDLIEKVATEGHMDALALVDTFGGLSPSAIPYFVKKVRERIDQPLEAHFHDDFGIGVANTLLALASGVEVAHTTITGIGERAGNVAYEDLVLTLLTMYNQDLGIKTEKMYQTSKLLREITGSQIRDNRPIVGEKLFNIESGIIASWSKNCGQEHLLELAPFTPDLVGQKPQEVVLGKNSGLDSIKIKADELGYNIDEKDAETILKKIKDEAFKQKNLINNEKFLEILQIHLGGK
jgi:isopropylmalate/homocitrate/citramalate synthase